MRIVRPLPLSVAFGILGLAVGCSEDNLGSTLGVAQLSLCDRGDACGCDIVTADTAIDFGSPEPGTIARRTVRYQNPTDARVVTLRDVILEDESGAFAIAAVQKRSNDSNSAQVFSHDIESGLLRLEGSQVAEIFLTFEPTTSDEHVATLRVRGDSAGATDWVATLRGGAGGIEVCHGEDNCSDALAVDFGSFQDAELNRDFEVEQTITVSNTGSAELFLGVELTKDGIPEATRAELPGELGVFELGELGCLVVPPGESLDIPVFYRPFVAGAHEGEVVVASAAGTTVVSLSGKVIGAHICIRTEDDQPDDATLQFGDAPLYNTPQNTIETRRFWVKNCGLEEDLTIDSVEVLEGSSPDFVAAALMTLQGETLAEGEEREIEVVYTPDAAARPAPTLAPVGARANARFQLDTNDRFRPSSLIDLRALVGLPEQCTLIANPAPMDFGWVAYDEAGASTCNPTFPGCPGLAGELYVARDETLTFVNVGQRPCRNITLSDIAHPGEPHFEIVSDPYNGNTFTLAPQDASQPFTVRFFAEPSDTAVSYVGKLPYTSEDLWTHPTPIELLLRAKGGGSPSCSVMFQPTTPPNGLCSVDSVRFGSVNMGQERTIDVKVVNIGSDTCQITNIRRAPGTSSVFTFPTTPMTIAVGDSAVLPVTFAPMPAGGANPFEPIGNLLCMGNSIEMNVNSGPGGAIETETLALTGNGTSPDIDVIPGDLDFGEVTVGCCSAPKRVAVYNNGDGTLTINSVTVAASSDQRFEVVDGPTDTEIEPGENTEMWVRYCAQDEGTAVGVVEIASTDNNEEFFAISVSGTGTLESEASDAYRQPTRPKVDVLWAVDDSGSMSDEQDNLASNFDRFISQAVSLDTDYHLGVVTTDSQSDQAGHLYACSGNPLWITDALTTQEQQDQFRCNVRTTNSGRPNSDNKESPLQASRMALDYPNIDGFNAGFYRADAKLYVILVTDERDQSDGTPQLYVDFFTNLKGLGNPDLLNISAIAGPPPDGCTGAEGNQFDFDAVDAVGGTFRSICTTDWSDMIADLGLDVFNARRQFALDRPATESTLVVKVCQDDGSGNPDAGNCVTVPQSSTNGWTFDATLNAITFNGDSVPGPGEHLVVEYVAVCF